MGNGVKSMGQHEETIWELILREKKLVKGWRREVAKVGGPGRTG